MTSSSAQEVNRPEESEIIEGELLEGPGTYQGVNTNDNTVNKKQLQQKKQQMMQVREILRKEQDILGTLFPPTPQRSQAAKRERPVKKVTKRTTASF